MAFSSPARRVAHNRSGSAILRRTVLALHLWVGLVLGLHFALLGVTGSLLVFHNQIDTFLNPQLLRVVPGPTRASADAMLLAVKRAHPNAQIDRVVLPTRPDGALEVRFKSDGERFKAAVDPFSARYLGERGVKGYFMGVVLYLHMDLLLGERGEMLNGYASLLFALLLASGLWLWLPSRRGFKKALPTRLKVTRGASLRRRMHDLHNVFGFYSLPLLLLIVLTGSAFVFHEAVENAVFALTGTSRKIETEFTATPGASLPRQRLLDVAQSVVPQGRLDRFYPEEGSFSARFEAPGVGRGDSYVTVSLDAATGKIMEIDDARAVSRGQRVLNWLTPLHFGDWGGLTVRVIYALCGLMPLSLFLTGLWKWNDKRRGRAKNRARRKTGRYVEPEPVGIGS